MGLQPQKKHRSAPYAMARVLNWERVLNDNGIPFVDRGPNVKRGEINIRCPFCGSADPSHHMGLSLETGWWSCWRNRREHSGKSPVRLLMRLLRVSYEEARAAAGLDPSYLDPEGFGAVADRVLRRINPSTRRAEEGAPRPQSLEFQTEFRRLAFDYSMAAVRFRTYLCAIRGFRPQDIDDLAMSYGLRYAFLGDFANRLVIPYYDPETGHLVTWTARHVGASEIRYKDLHPERSVVPVKETVFVPRDLKRRLRCTLVVVEGPIDALKLDYYGRDFGVTAVALSTNSISMSQLYYIAQLADTFDQTVVMMDNASSLGIVDSMKLKDQLVGVPRLSIVPVPFGAKDAAELSPSEIMAAVRSL